MTDLYYMVNGFRIKGPWKYFYGDTSKVYGDCSNIHGDASGLKGDCTDFFGYCGATKLDLDSVKATKKRRKKGINVHRFNTFGLD